MGNVGGVGLKAGRENSANIATVQAMEISAGRQGQLAFSTSPRLMISPEAGGASRFAYSLSAAKKSDEELKRQIVKRERFPICWPWQQGTDSVRFFGMLFVAFLGMGISQSGLFPVLITGLLQAFGIGGCSAGPVMPCPGNNAPTLQSEHRSQSLREQPNAQT